MLEQKYNKLKGILEDLGSAAVAFSGGVDSTFLIKVCKDILDDKAIAITATSSTYPQREFKEACELVKNIDIQHIIIESEETDIDGFAKNPPNRCYFCKHELFTKVQEVAKSHGMKYVLDGSNFDDIGDFRPGMKAAKDLEVRSPLKEAELTKDDIRVLSKRLDLPTWDKPAFACLSSRFPYGQEITPEKLLMVEKSEDYLRELGFNQFRVRHHGEIARIEVYPEERIKFFNTDILDKVSDYFKGLGFTYVTLDMRGYRTGSMNEVLKKPY
ncbi:ATP-dependent sacrificial sulfur transferase LarE [Sporosalibacterium faouarense]|uniref:ATP-dependent sacrificial sulfur transferase LarE n=1 Tax=Sporosalibacterium faouarense TaxID=516123 RepID=UPI00141D5AF1|nr:ATP-dependent sacrificial sulfur transferase LarE [Sporosalibacterium faouarense]MTI48544.1 ATP-dependent sacrificial sulfur transferase LarE [Bacillota bacterium]